MTPELLVWVGFVLFMLGMLALDLGAFHRRFHVVSVETRNLPWAKRQPAEERT